MGKVSERSKKIAAIIEEQRFATVSELASLFQVSEMTIRRDLDRLSEQGRIIRTFGGGVPIKSVPQEIPPESNPVQENDETSPLFHKAQVLIAALVDTKYDPIILGNDGQPKYPIIAESVAYHNCLTCVSVDNYQGGFALGQWAGEYALTHFAGKAKVLDLTYHLPNTEARSRGFLDGLAETISSPEFTISLNPQSRFDLSYQLTRDALEVNQDINIIFAINDTNAWGAIQACKDLKVDPDEIVVISFGLEGDTLKNELKEGQYCKVALAMFPEIVGQTCIDAAVLVYRAQDLPINIVTPFALVTRESLNKFYIKKQTGWELQWDHISQQLDLPAIWESALSSAELPIPDCIGILIPFPRHEWYQNLIIAMKAYASKSKINIEVIDAEQNLKDELEFRKREIARRAAQEISPGDVIIIDGGTVTKYLVEFIQELTDITVITNAVQIFKGLEENPHITLISTGGVLRRNSGSLVGPIAENFLRDMRADKLFLTVSGVSIDFGLSHTHVSEVTIKQAMINSARQVILLGEHTKFDQESFTQIAPIDVVDVLITDNGLPASSRLQLNTAGIDVIIAHT